ncbi:hypothetical protein [Rhizobium rhizogenes]|uniref:hypothetical protein n=1 Tax=Rhizobium rhizogenes TaxID=359 RepID=UPI001573C43B|nr:hypothetical protein [Rhizobium rhizogenes]NTF48505.1 hypothetical protein [Rhizobium rhizogenes]NTH05890.1 hypothetical protein [Rhizobium rhizogenes]
MANPRKPLALAKIDGSAKKNPQRYRGLNEPTVRDALGDPPDYLIDTESSKPRQAWYLFAQEAEWLNASHRPLVEAASLIRGDIVAGHVPGVQRLSLLRQLLQQMGMTPATAAHANAAVGEPEDPDDKFFDD